MHQCEWCDEDFDHEPVRKGQRIFCSNECRDESTDEELCHDDWYDDDYLIDGVGFADPGGRSALRAETPENPRNLPCPTCGRENVLTPLDVRRGYQCDRCADAAKGI